MHREQIEELARAADVGAVRRIHRVRDRLLSGIALGLAVPSAVFVFTFDGLVASAIAFLVALSPLPVIYLAPRIGATARDFVAVCDGGLVVSDRRIGTTPVEWDTIVFPIDASNPLTTTSLKFIYADVDEIPVLVDFAEYSGAWTLAQELTSRRPMPKSPARPILMTVLIGAAVFALAYFGLGPKFGTDEEPAGASAIPVQSDSPSPSAVPDIVALGDMCAEPGPRRGTVAYQGDGVHPVAIFEGPEWIRSDNAELGVLPSGWEAATIADVELVVCADIGTGAKIDTCDFGDGIVYGVYETRYSFRVHAAATGALVDEVSRVATAFSCPPAVHDDGGDRAFEALLSPGEVETIFSDWVEEGPG